MTSQLSITITIDEVTKLNASDDRGTSMARVVITQDWSMIIEYLLFYYYYYESIGGLVVVTPFDPEVVESNPVIDVSIRNI